ncbi:MAG TPA: hypothetical protein VJP80_02635 [Candidatus Saccharimonadales bacterium]|nr:hypothetical protein [Candidatus Saccharimonadales bacterium]
MSKTVSSGQILGATSTVGSSAALPIATGHRALAVYAIGIALGCAALIIISKCIKRALERWYARPF